MENFENFISKLGVTSSFLNSTMNHMHEFAGVFPRDSMPILKKPGKFPIYMVINSDTSAEAGEHWLGLILYNNKCLYFDSFGGCIQHKSILKYLKKYNYTTYEYSSRTIQPYYSSMCGYYVLAFILSIHCGMTYSSFIDQFNYVKYNDNIVINILNKISSI